LPVFRLPVVRWSVVALGAFVGWLSHPSAQQAVVGTAPAKPRYVQGSWVNLRESAQPQSRIVAQVPANTVLQQLTERDGWCAVLYTGDARLGPPLPEPLQAHIACNLLADQPLTLAQAGKDAARAFWVAPSPNRLRAYGNALPRPPALQLSALVKSHTPEMSVQYPIRPEWEFAKKLLRTGVPLRPEQEIDRGRPVNPLDDLKLATRGSEYQPAVAPLATKPALPAIAPCCTRPTPTAWPPWRARASASFPKAYRTAHFSGTAAQKSSTSPAFGTWAWPIRLLPPRSPSIPSPTRAWWAHAA
jgi:hypothetical protein